MSFEIIEHKCKHCGCNTAEKIPTPNGTGAMCTNCMEIDRLDYTSSPTVNTPKCPICQSTNLSKITNMQKATKIVALGVFGMGDNGKTWKCNNCGSRF